MGVCTCTSPDGSVSTTYEFEEGVPYDTDCDIACRNWQNPSFTLLFPFGSPEFEARRNSCKMWVKDCGSPPEWISVSEPRLQCTFGDKVGAKLNIDHGGKGEDVDISLKVLKASNEIVDYAFDGTPQYAGVEGPLMTITNPNSPFFGLQVKTCMVNGFDAFVYNVTRYPSSEVNPIAETAWGDVDVSTGDNVGQIAIPLFKFRKHGERIDSPNPAAYALNPFYNPDAICSVEDYFDLTGETWETIGGVGSGCDFKVYNLFVSGLGSGTGLHKSISDYETGCRMELGELLPHSDFDEMYNRDFSTDKMFQEYSEVASECAEEDNPYELDAYCALYHWNWQNDGVCEGYDVQNNPLGTAWWQGTSNAFGQSENQAENDAVYAEWLRNYLVNEQGIEALSDASDDEILEYATLQTNANFMTSPEGLALDASQKSRMACVVTKMYERYPDEFDWRGAFSPQNTSSGSTLLPESLIGQYDWFDEDDVLFDGYVTAQTFSPTSNSNGWETLPLPEGLVKLPYYEVTPEGQEVVAEFRGEVEVQEGVNDARTSLTDDDREPEGVFLPDDPEIEIAGADNDLIESIEQGQIDDEQLKSLFSEESAEEVADMFEVVEEEPEVTQGEEPADTQEEEPADTQEEEPADTQEEEPEDTQEQEPDDTQEADDIEVFDEQDSQTQNQVQNQSYQAPVLAPLKSQDKTSILQSPIFLGVVGAILVGAIVYYATD